MLASVVPRIPKVRLFNKAEVADAFQVSLPTVNVWIREGCPVVTAGDRGVSWELDVFAVYAWRQGDDETTGSRVLDPQQERAALDRARRESVEMDNRKKAGDLVSVEDVADEWSRITGIIKDRMLALPSKLAAEIVLISSIVDAEELLMASVNQMLIELSSGDDAK